jgi:uncharacterized surface protein with fasciclin (FAS1) repeats
MKKQLIAAAAAITGLTLAVAPTVDARPGKPGDANIVEIAVANGSFTTLIAAASCTPGIVDALTGDDKLTVFAPTDGAFAGLGLNAGNVCDVFDTATLGEILTYHVTDGRRFSNSVFNRNNSKSISMLNGGTVVSNPGLTLTDQLDRTINIVAANINASNGVIHVIDNVLLPVAP